MTSDADSSCPSASPAWPTAFTDADVRAAVSARRDFYNALLPFSAARGEPIHRLPIFDHRELDYYALYVAVRKRGGLDAIVSGKLWRHVVLEMHVDQQRTDAGFRLRVHYEKTLVAFERHQATADPDDPYYFPLPTATAALVPPPLNSAAARAIDAEVALDADWPTANLGKGSSGAKAAAIKGARTKKRAKAAAAAATAAASWACRT